MLTIIYSRCITEKVPISRRHGQPLYVYVSYVTIIPDVCDDTFFSYHPMCYPSIPLYFTPKHIYIYIYAPLGFGNVRPRRLFRITVVIIYAYKRILFSKVLWCTRSIVFPYYYNIEYNNASYFESRTGSSHSVIYCRFFSSFFHTS